MERQEYTYHLTNKAGLYYYVDNDVVKTTSTITPLEYSPDGWKDKIVNYTRNETYYGVFRSFTIPLRFVKTSAQILRERLYKFGMEDIVNLIIKRLNYTTGDYDDFYIGEIDFSKFQDSLNFFQVNVIEGGLIKYLKAYEGVTQEIPLNIDYIKIKMDGIKIKSRYTYGIIDDAIRGSGSNFTVGCVLGSTEGTGINLITGNSPLLFSGGAPPFTDRYIIKNIDTTDSIDTVVSGSLIFTLEASLFVSGDINIQFQTTSGVYFFIQAPSTLATNKTYNKNFSFNIKLSPGDALYITGFYSNFFSASPGIIFGQTDVYIETLSRLKTTIIKGKKALNLGNEIIKKLADTSYSLESTILKNTTIAITSGDAIRGIKDAIIKTNYKDFFSSFNRNLNISGRIDGKKFIIEPKRAAYNNTILYDLGEIKDAQFNFYETLLANSIKVGYHNQNYDNVNGKDEFNNTSEFKAPITRINKTFDLTASYRADMYGIEFTRINLDNKTTTDNNSDNDVFMLDVEYDFIDADGIENYKLRRLPYTSISGLIDSTSAFNIELSPATIIHTHGAEIRGMLWPYVNEKITFQTTNKNPLLKRTLGGITIQENADILISDLDPNYWIPIIGKIETVVPDNLTDIMRTNSTGLFKFTYNGNEYKGWVITCGQKPSTNASQDWILLLSADNNINNLINGN